MNTPEHTMAAAAAPTLVITPLRCAAPVRGAMEALVRVQAPVQGAAMAAARSPLRLSLVIDRSGSMSGQPLHEALRCVEYIAQRLSPADQVAVVLYDDQVRVALPLRAGGDPQAVRAALAGVHSGGSTALFDGWHAGASLLRGGDPASVSRVILLSDGQANHGLCDPGEIAQQCQGWAALGVATTTVGLGPNFNEDLMIEMARAGGGRQYYGQAAEDLHDGFDEELSLLQSLFMREVRLKLSPAPGVIVEALGLVHRLGEGAFALPDLAYGAEAWMLLRLHIDKPSVDPREPQALLAATVEGRVQATGLPSGASGMLSLPLVDAADWAGLPADDLVARRLKEVEFAQASGRIADLAAAGDMAAAQAMLAGLRSQVADHPWLADKLQHLERLAQRDARLAAKELKYSRMRNLNRLAPQSEAAYEGSETDRIDMPAFLRRKGVEGQGRKRGD